MINHTNKNKAREIAILKSAVENTAEAFVTIDEKHTVVFFNKAAQKIFGYSPDEVMGHDLNMIMAPDCSRDHYVAVKRYVETRIPRRIGHATEMIATRKNGEKFPANISFSTFELEKRLYFTAIITDLTETKALQERTLRAERLAALGKTPAELSGGERVRVALALQLITKPKILLLDEPFGDLDPITLRDVSNYLKKINDEFGTTMVLISHHIQLIKEISDRAILIDEGKIIMEGKPEDVCDTFIERSNSKFLK